MGIYNVDIKACNEEKECAINSFNIIVNGSDYVTDDDTNVGDITNLITVDWLSIIAIVCAAGFCISLIAIGGVCTFVRYRNKISKKESFTNTEELQEMELADDEKIVVDNELPRPLDEQKISQEVKRDEELVYYPD
jgi:hypothetical protein